MSLYNILNKLYLYKMNYSPIINNVKNPFTMEALGQYNANKMAAQGVSLPFKGAGGTGLNGIEYNNVTQTSSPIQEEPIQEEPIQEEPTIQPEQPDNKKYIFKSPDLSNYISKYQTSPLQDMKNMYNIMGNR